MVHQIQNEKLTVDVNSLGAELFSVKNSDGTEYIWQGTAPYWNSRACIIFPICGRLYDGKYTYQGNEYEMKCHGFARSTEFVKIDSDENTLAFKLVATEETKKE